MKELLLGGSGNLWEGQEEVLEDYPAVCFESYGEIMIQAALMFLESLKLKVKISFLEPCYHGLIWFQIVTSNPF